MIEDRISGRQEAEALLSLRDFHVSAEHAQAFAIEMRRFSDNMLGPHWIRSASRRSLPRSANRLFGMGCRPSKQPSGVPEKQSRAAATARIWPTLTSPPK